MWKSKLDQFVTKKEFESHYKNLNKQKNKYSKIEDELTPGILQPKAKNYNFRNDFCTSSSHTSQEEQKPAEVLKERDMRYNYLYNS